MKAKPQKKNGAEYTISQVCRQTGFSADTLRFYEKAGLLTAIPRRNGRRVYTEENLRALKLVDCLKKTGMPLAEIAEFVRLSTQGDKTVRKRLEMMRNRFAAVDSMIKEMQACADYIAFKVWYYEVAAKEGLATHHDMEKTVERYRRETGRDFIH
ncbi:MAG: MerR family transcriptional regulator [Kiritimatiellia bacterium]